MERNGSQAVSYALDLQAWLAEVEYQPEPQAGCFESVDALCSMRLIQCTFTVFKFDTGRMEHGKGAADDVSDRSFSLFPSACVRVHLR